MRSPEIEPARLERLLAGFAPETAQEAILQGLVRELRAGMSEAPLALRERVRALTMPEPRRRPAVTRRRVAVVALAAVGIAAVGAFALLRRWTPARTRARRSADERSAVPSSRSARQPAGRAGSRHRVADQSR